MRSKLVIVVVALTLGGLAAVLAASYLNGARQDIAGANEPVTVLVAQENLPRGLSGEELMRRKLVKMQKVPRQFVSVDAVSSTRGVENQVLAVSVMSGEQLTRARFQYPVEAGLAYSVPEDYVAIACQVDEVSGVAGLIKPSDQVMVYATMKGDPSKKQDAKTFAVIGQARVLAVGASIGVETQETEVKSSGSGALGNGSDNDSQPASTVTLALTPNDAARLVFAQEEGKVRLALLPAEGSKLEAPTPVSFSVLAP